MMLCFYLAIVLLFDPLLVCLLPLLLRLPTWQGTTRHLGIGADFEGDDGPQNFPTDLTNVSTYPNLVAEMIRRGYTDEEIIGVLGGNILRVLRGVESVAAQAAAGHGGLNLPLKENRLIYDDIEETATVFNGSCRSDF
jgi:hypothetical protein